MSTVPPNGPIAPRPAAGRAGRRHAPRITARGRAVGGLLAVLIAIVLAGRSPDAGQPTAPAAATPVPTANATVAPSAVAPTEGNAPALLFLGNVEGPWQLSLLSPTGGVVPLPLPDSATVAVAPVAGGGLVALTADGRAYGAPGGAAALAAGGSWDPLPLAADGALPPASVIYPGASVSPGGMAVAAAALQPDGGGHGAIVVIMLHEQRMTIYSLEPQVAGLPSAWLDDERFAVLGRDVMDRINIGVVRAADGRILDLLRRRAPYLVTSGDGQTVAVAGADALEPGRIRIGTTAQMVRERALPDRGPSLPAGAYPSGGMALDGDGRRLAVVATGDHLDAPARVFLFERAGEGWREVAMVAAPAGASGGTIAWLP